MVEPRQIMVAWVLHPQPVLLGEVPPKTVPEDVDIRAYCKGNLTSISEKQKAQLERLHERLRKTIHVSSLQNFLHEVFVSHPEDY